MLIVPVADLSFLAEEPIPALALVIGGILSIAIAVYGVRGDSYWDEVGTFFAFILGAAMVVLAFMAGIEETINWLTLVILATLAFTLFLKPMREIPWSGVIGAVVGGGAALALSLVLPSKAFGIDEWIILLVVFLIIGGIVHAIFHFLEDLLAVATMVLQWKPTMVLVGLAAIAEGALLLLDRSILSFL